MSSRQVLDGTRRGRWSETSSTVTSGLIAEFVGSSPGLKSPALILSPLVLLEYQP
jgi:hypothetical protein